MNLQSNQQANGLKELGFNKRLTIMKINKMDNYSEYHSDIELNQLKNWDILDAHNLVDKLRDMWQYKDYFIENWGLDDIFKQPVLILELHTGGWSGNEDIIHSLKLHELFFTMWWWKSERGGHYYFEIDYSQIGFKPVREFLKEKKISRQYVYKCKDKFEWIKISHGKRLIREKI